MSKVLPEVQLANEGNISEKNGNIFRKWGTINGRRWSAKPDDELNKKSPKPEDDLKREKREAKEQKKEGKKQRTNGGLARTDSSASISKQNFIPRMITGGAAAAFNKLASHARRGSKGSADSQKASNGNQAALEAQSQPVTDVAILPYNPRGANETSDALSQLSTIIFSVAMDLAPRVASFPGFYSKNTGVSISKGLATQSYEDAFRSDNAAQHSKAYAIAAVISAYIWDAILELRVFTPEAAADLEKVSKCPYAKADSSKNTPAEEQVLEARMVYAHGFRKDGIPEAAEAVVRKEMVALFEHLFPRKSSTPTAARKVPQASVASPSTYGNRKAVTSRAAEVKTGNGVPVVAKNTKGADWESSTFSGQFRQSGFSHLWSKAHDFLHTYDPSVQSHTVALDSSRYTTNPLTHSEGSTVNDSLIYKSANGSAKSGAQVTRSFLKLSPSEGSDYSSATDLKPLAPLQEAVSQNSAPSQESEEFKLIVNVLGQSVWRQAMNIKNQKGKLDASFTPRANSSSYRQAQRDPKIREVLYFDDAATNSSLRKGRWDEYPSDGLVWFPEVTIYKTLPDDTDDKLTGIAYQARAAINTKGVNGAAAKTNGSANGYANGKTNAAEVGAFHDSRVMNARTVKGTHHKSQSHDSIVKASSIKPLLPKQDSYQTHNPPGWARKDVVPGIQDMLVSVTGDNTQRVN
ncbi:hypothetical protein DFH27DRAFT_116682 [Peziza echinospora]|nr:hypothetical protein DFH27DRAFT_116682 [Peziza echinospora]